MPQPFEDQQPPRVTRPVEEPVREALEASAQHLVGAAQHLAGAAPDYREALRHSLQAIRQAYTGFLVWHDLPPRPETTLNELAVPAEHLASMLRTVRRRARSLEPLEATFGGGAARSVKVREDVEAGFYTARNTLAVVLGELPARLTREAARTLHRAQALRVGRLSLAPEEPAPRRAVQTASARPAAGDAAAPPRAPVAA